MSLPERLLVRLAELSTRHPKRVLLVAGLVAALALGLAAARLELRTSNLDLVDPELPEVARFRAAAAEMGTPNLLSVVIEGQDPEAVARAVDRLGPALADLPGVRGLADRAPFDADALEILGMDPYLRSDDGLVAVILVQPDDPESRADRLEPFVRGVREAIRELDPESLGVEVGLTGMPAYALDDREVIEQDISRLSGLGALLVALIFAWAYGGRGRPGHGRPENGHAHWRWLGPVAALVALCWAVAVGLGAASIVPGHLTLLSAFFASILFGLGIDFAIHLLDRFRERSMSGEGMVIAVSELARALWIGAGTTASVFFAMQFSGFRGFAELGLVAGMGVLLCLLAMVTLLPALCSLGRTGSLGGRIPLSETRDGNPSRFLPGRRERHGRGQAPPLHPERVISDVGAGPGPGRAAPARGAKRPFRILAWGALALAVVGTVLPGPAFDGDYLDLQPADSEAVRLERLLVERTDWSPLFALFRVDDREEMQDLLFALADEETVGAVRSVRDFELGGWGGASVSPELPEGLENLFVADSGRFAVYAFPAGDLWDPEQSVVFRERMRALDPEVTGMPFLGDFMVRRSRRALHITAALASAILLLFVGLGLRHPLAALLAMLPAFLTVTSLHALMRLLGLDYNPLDIMALPVVMGIAVDDGVHMVHRFRVEKGDLARTLAGTGRSVLTTSLTTLAAFGCLAFTRHRGLASFAQVLCLGVLCALVLSLVALPELLHLCRRSLCRDSLGDEPASDVGIMPDGEAHQKLEAAAPVAGSRVVEKGTGGGKPLPYARKFCNENLK